MQSAPPFTGWSGMPSSLTTRPSRLRAMTPQPAGHSRHTVENHDATPGTICSLGTTSGSSFSVACWQPAAAAVAPVVATILKKSRRLNPRRGASRPKNERPGIRSISSLIASVVAGDAVDRGVGAALGVLIAMAVDAPAHRQGRLRRTQADEVDQVVGQPGARLGSIGGHGLHR